MSLIIETGAGVTGADSYATAAALVSRAAAYGWTIPATTDAQNILLRRAAEAMNGMDWKGRRVKALQALDWPRFAVTVDFETLAATAIPAQILFGQMALAAEIHTDDIVSPDTKKGAVIEETVDVLTVKYAAVTNDGRVLRAAPHRPSAVQFADFLHRRGLFAVRA